MSLVGIIANPASGKDIRRLVAYGSTFDNEEKVRIVRRVLMGLAAVGVEHVCYMPDTYGIVERAKSDIDIPFPTFPTPIKRNGDQGDSIQASRLMAEDGVDCVITLGGDGTNRAVAKGSTSIPMLPISTGTNNVFPRMIEGTLAGLAAALVANKLLSSEESTYHSTLLEVMVDGELKDLALVDAAVYDDIFIGSRAVWEMTKVTQIFLNRAEPSSIGLSSIGGLIHPVTANSPEGLYLQLGSNKKTGKTVTAPVAPGIIQPVSIKKKTIMKTGKEIKIQTTPSVLALDGERELEISDEQRAAVRLSKDGPTVVDVEKTLTAAVARKIFTDPALLSQGRGSLNR
jgi:predicted polyphosphate/ATP-dependent NAD kinase